ncbi:hypothetical protein K461DRAFT_104247 [Myriangium duriaei CBS 260.36]|uniref:Uncharacterized protein n=1 Tax=Myriangium duriaei CBS 260.36 TaxID=1168546 RepID=A0A9P4J3S5_9PEZI|nr:hypothetical protein K461DRAFT_104247 [Myriangium duriaei CBS 260.36]
MSVRSFLLPRPDAHPLTALQALNLYHRASAALLAAQGTILFLSPSIATWLLSSSPQGSASSIDALLSRLLALSQLTLSFLTLLFSGEISALYAAADGGESTESPYAKPTLAATLAYHAAVGVLLYIASSAAELSGTWLALGATTHIVLAAAGGLLVLFGQGPGHISRRTGADKRTSGFPFKNTEAEKKRR